MFTLLNQECVRVTFSANPDVYHQITLSPLCNMRETCSSNSTREISFISSNIYHYIINSCCLYSARCSYKASMSDTTCSSIDTFSSGNKGWAELPTCQRMYRISEFKRMSGSSWYRAESVYYAESRAAPRFDAWCRAFVPPDMWPSAVLAQQLALPETECEDIFCSENNKKKTGARTCVWRIHHSAFAVAIKQTLPSISKSTPW